MLLLLFFIIQWYKCGAAYAEISLFSTESYLSVNIENMNKEKNILKIRQLYFLCLKDNIYKFLNRTT